MKKLLPIVLVTLGLAGGINASQATTDESVAEYNYLRVYGLGLKVGYPDSDIKDETYGGVGIGFENNFANFSLEYGAEYTMGAGVLKYDITKNIYAKGGLGYLQKEMVILGLDTDVTQTTIAGALGYGDEKSYNIEVGYIVSKLDDAATADGYSSITFSEVVAKHSFGEYLTFDAVGIAKNTNVFNKNYDDYKAELGWYANDDVRVFASLDSVNHDKNNYSVQAGIQYAFVSGEFSPYLRAITNTNENTEVGLEYSQGISNISLKMRDFFENTVKSVEITAQVVAPEVFAQKVAVQTNNTVSSNNAPIGLSFTTSSLVVDLASLISDADGDNMTVNFVSSSSIAGNPINSAGISGTIATISFIGGESGSEVATITYTVSDGTDTSEVYTITFNFIS